jgi:hypothetical protein
MGGDPPDSGVPGCRSCGRRSAIEMALHHILKEALICKVCGFGEFRPAAENGSMQYSLSGSLQYIVDLTGEGEEGGLSDKHHECLIE